ncbi:hypothetical protein BDA99DRAFT_536723 [Phascolomyces articulosus]|uniref:Uncharacterized protein n=1 Tax=Phascolomyces articulosus TaxID=60185 RepID=A0AAD5KGD4_9FUNG|nr:hypothetical protein BDA99DRAFT_536723 [Phascolomyces articulosus]
MYLQPFTWYLSVLLWCSSLINFFYFCNGKGDDNDDNSVQQYESNPVGQASGSKHTFDDFEAISRIGVIDGYCTGLIVVLNIFLLMLSHMDPSNVEDLSALDTFDNYQDNSWDVHKKRKYLYAYLVNVNQNRNPTEYWIASGLDITAKLMVFRNRKINHA